MAIWDRGNSIQNTDTFLLIFQLWKSKRVCLDNLGSKFNLFQCLSYAWLSSRKVLACFQKHWKHSKGISVRKLAKSFAMKILLKKSAPDWCWLCGGIGSAWLANFDWSWVKANDVVLEHFCTRTLSRGRERNTIHFSIRASHGSYRFCFE